MCEGVIELGVMLDPNSFSLPLFAEDPDLPDESSDEESEVDEVGEALFSEWSQKPEGECRVLIGDIR